MVGFLEILSVIAMISLRRIREEILDTEPAMTFKISQMKS